MSPNPWHKTRRSVERDYKFYDSPRVVYQKITQATWPYSDKNLDRVLFALRDLSFMCLLYVGTFRSSELCRFTKKKDGLVLFNKPSAVKSQFIIQDGFLKFRDNIVLKRSEPVYEDGKQVFKPVKRKRPAIDTEGNIISLEYRPVYKPIESLDKYPRRVEIKMPMEGDMNIFTLPVLTYLKYLDTEQELFPFMYRRGWQIVNKVTKEMQHYLRDMGIKFYSRLVDRNLQDLKEFTGHERIQNLTKYLGEGQLEQKLKEVKF